MELEKVKGIVKAKQNGSFVGMEWERELPVRAAYKGNTRVIKKSKGVVRFGVEYDNIKAVQQKRKDGELPSENEGLKWGEWEEYPYFIKHNEKHYLRCTESHNNRVRTEYLLNGRPVSKDELESICTKAAFTQHQDLDVFTINIDNIVAIKE